ncbi:MAG: 2-hydroxychromene-2-carboxylate isomerase [Betaproteobacteria bacterium]|jgi:2-hydroxychromene-2-carboxylate isomerase|nr:2-hydroxychromene-2-carboxylate isomerase [Betaproteobacteria bacterium]NBS46317.1 2-hydroxychromene-2-carboxylate isomerase [Betaproteobacteria bacterium]
MQDTLDFYFDCSSPWTYLAFHNVQTLARDLGVTVHWKPVLVGGIFNAINPSVYQMRENPIPAKWAYNSKDLADWTRDAGLRPILFPPRVFPVNSVKAMRACIWLLHNDPARFIAFTRCVFERYWHDDQDISQDAVLAAIAAECGIDAHALLQGMAEPAIKEELKANTDEVIRRGGFGSPTMFVGDDMYFGNDRLVLVRSALLRRRNGLR